MPPYRIEVYWPGVTREDMDDLVGRALAATRRRDSGVTYVGCEVAPHDETVSLRVTARDQAAVQTIVVKLDLPDVRIAAVLDIPSPDASM